MIGALIVGVLCGFILGVVVTNIELKDKIRNSKHRIDC